MKLFQSFVLPLCLATPLIFAGLSQAAAPANNDFGDRAMLSGALPISVSGTTAEATRQTNEPYHAGYGGNNSVWWTWTAPGTGDCEFSVSNLGFTPSIAVYTGTAINTLTSVASIGYYGTKFVTKVTSGTVYQIAVDAPNGTPGPFNLNLSALAAQPANDNFSNAISLSSGPVTVTAHNMGASKETGEPDHATVVGGRSLWYNWTAPVTGECTMSVATTTGFYAQMGLYTGNAVNALSQVSSAIYNGSVLVRVTQGQLYRVAVDTLSGASPITLTIGVTSPTPGNDLFANRAVIPPAGGTVTGTNLASWFETNEPAHADMTGERTVWWTWTPTSSGTFEINTDGSGFRPALAVYTGSAVNALTRVARSGPGSAGNRTRVIFAVTAGTQYQIAVSAAPQSFGWDGVLMGTVKLNVLAAPAAPANQNFANAVLISGSTLPVTVRGSNAGAFTASEAGEPTIPESTYDVSGSTVWWRWLAPAGVSTVRVNTVGGDFDTQVAVYTGSTLGGLTTVASNNNYYNGSLNVAQSELTFSATAGTYYYIAVGGNRGAQGTITLNLMSGQTPPNDLFANATVLPSSASVSVQGWIDVNTSYEGGEPDIKLDADQWWQNSGRTVWWKWVAPASGLYEISTAGSSFDTVLGVYTGNAVYALTLVTRSEDAAADGTSRLALSAVSGSTYYFRVRGQTMVSNLGVVALSVAAPYGNPTTAADYVRLGRAELEKHTDAGMASAQAAFAQALALDANHQEANLLQAITSFAMLEQTSAFQNTLTALGVLDSNLYAGRYNFPKNGLGKPVPAVGSTTSSGVAYLTNTVLPALPTLRAMLDKVGPGAVTGLSDTETSAQYVRIDSGDVAMMKAASYGLEAMIRFVQTFEVGASVETIVNDFNNDQFNLEKAFGTLTQVLNATGTDQRVAFKTAFQSANTLYQSASEYIRTQRPAAMDAVSLFSIPGVNLTREAEFRGLAQSVATSMNGQTSVGGEPVDLSKFVSSDKSLREVLPGLVGNKVVASSAPDATFNGVVPNASQASVNAFARKHGLLHEVNTFSAWSQYFLKSQTLGNQAKNADPDMDMLNNFAEFAFNLNPAKTSKPGEYQVSALQTNVSDGKKYLHITFPRRIVRTAISYVVAVSDNLTTWDRTQAQVQQVGSAVATGDGETEMVTYRVLAEPAVTGRKFVRVEVTDLAP